MGGAITTAGAGLVMFACQLLFFVKMAILIVSTIILSTLYSLYFFMGILLLIGPENDVGTYPWFKSKWEALVGKGTTKTIPESTSEKDLISNKETGVFSD